MAMKHYQQLIGGRWQDPVSGEWLDSFNPYTGEPWARIPSSGQADAALAVQAARRAFTSGEWPAMTASKRGALLCRVADLIAESAQQLAVIETRDNGKLLSEMRAQVNYVPEWYRYYGGLADKTEGGVLPTDKPDMFNFTRYEPLGPVLAITAWNSPLLLAAYKVAPALAAGNTVILKPSEHASVSTLEFARLFDQAGFPPGVVNVITGLGGEVGGALVDDPGVEKVTFTGSGNTGRTIASRTGQNLKGVLLELGGKSPNIVFPDADIDNAVNGAISGIFAASGQTCVAGSRLLLHDSIHDAFLEKLLALIKQVRIGDPAQADTQIGPITTPVLHKAILDYIDIAIREGAQCVTGGKAVQLPESPKGWFIEPTILAGVKNAMRIAREEVFGPVLSVLKFHDDEEAIAIANDSEFGLAAGVWTSDMRRAMHMAERLQAGTVWINTYRVISYMSPIGGYKNSGLGWENGAEAIKQYMRIKSVWLSTAATVANPFVIR